MSFIPVHSYVDAYLQKGVICEHNNKTDIYKLNFKL